MQKRRPALVPESGDGPPTASCWDLAELLHEFGEARAELESGRARANGLGGEPEEEHSGILAPRESHLGGSHHREAEVSVVLFEAVDVLARVLVRHGGLDQEPCRVTEGVGVASLLLLDGESLAGDSLEVRRWHTAISPEDADAGRVPMRVKVGLVIVSGPDLEPISKPFGLSLWVQFRAKEGTRASSRDAHADCDGIVAAAGLRPSGRRPGFRAANTSAAAGTRQYPEREERLGTWGKIVGVTCA